MRVRGVIWCAAIVLMLAPMASEAAKPPPVVNLVISNFRYCRQSPCSPANQSYLRSPAGGSLLDNPTAMISVKAGSIVRWTYMDRERCDSANNGMFSCPGHEVRLDNGTPGGGKLLGFAKARQKKPQVITFTVPKSYAGRSIYYFCNVGGVHWLLGQTGILKVTK